jgi:TonB family protein
VIKARVPIAAVAGGLILLSAVWAGFRLFHSPAAPQQPAAATSYTPSQPIALPAPVAVPPAAAQSPPASQLSPLAVLHQEIPEASRSARESIRGRITVTIRVVVDRSGNVIHQSVEYSGSSRYFARLANDASKKWRFAPVDTQEPRVWLLRFEFSRSGTTGHATPRS